MPETAESTPRTENHQSRRSIKIKTIVPKLINFFRTELPETSLAKKIASMPIDSEWKYTETWKQWVASVSSNRELFLRDLDSPNSILVRRGLHNLQRVASSRYPPAQHLVSELLKDKFYLIEKEFHSNDPAEKSLTSVELAVCLATYGTEQQQRESQTFLKNNWQFLEKNIQENTSFGTQYARLVGTLYAHDVNIFEDTELSLPDIYNKIEYTTGQNAFVGTLLNSSVEGGVYEQGLKLLQEKLRSYELNPEEFLAAWKMIGIPIDKTVEYNLNAIGNLELQAPGCTKELTRRFGIHQFYRYPTDLLIQQYYNRDDMTKPYGVILNPYSDWNNSFADTINKRQEVYAFWRNIRNSHNVRIIECQDKTEIAARLLACKNTYGKISFMIIGAHGGEDRIVFGDGEAGSLYLEAIKYKQQESWLDPSQEYFEEDGSLIFNSCSIGGTTGRLRAEPGIAQRISRLLNINVFAPNRKITRIENLETEIKDGKIHFTVKYKNNDGPVPTKLFPSRVGR